MENEVAVRDRHYCACVCATVIYARLYVGSAERLVRNTYVRSEKEGIDRALE